MISEMKNYSKKIIRQIFGVLGINVSEIFLDLKRRHSKNHFEESYLIELYFKEIKLNRGVMLDVGAHFGESFLKYLNDEWNVYAFEPDPNPVKKSKLNKLRSDNLKLYDFAVSDESNKLLPFYSSEESTGISSLSAFTVGHKLIKNVKTITLRDFLLIEGIDKIDYLKIDTEGHDLFVLKGLPWDDVKVHPQVILCEFEDNKTKQLGYTYKDLGDFLLSKDYIVYMSEWHPIVRYGVKHKWRKMTRFPANLEDANGWGNFIAVKRSEKNESIKIFNKFSK